MDLYKLLAMLEPNFDPRKAKIHFARWDGDQHPIDVFKRGEFDEWQRWQNKRNFQCDLVLSLIQDAPRSRWLFAGLFIPTGCVQEQDPARHYWYDFTRVSSTQYLEGRMFCMSKYNARNLAPHCTTVEDITVVEILPERLTVADFPGYKKVDLSKSDLDAIVRAGSDSWRTALSSVKGIYLITDTKNGQLYVGKADGELGIWGRWSTYSSTGHGGNRSLKQELGPNLAQREKDLRFSLLEIADLHSAPGEIDARESHWKNVLMTRKTGYNLN